MVNNLSQFMLFTCAVVAVFLSQHHDVEFNKYASIVGLIGEPFWFHSAYRAKQWGIMACAVFYTLSWSMGFYNHWIVGA